LATVEATVIEKTKTAKVIVFKKKRRKGYKKTQGNKTVRELVQTRSCSSWYGSQSKGNNLLSFGQNNQSV